MTTSKIQVSLGTVSFSGEGEQDWLAQQLDKVLNSAPQIAAVQQPASHRGNQEQGGDAAGRSFATTLASYIREKSGETNQVDRFLATTDWLRQRGTDKLTTAAVTRALKDHHQKKLANPADCLNKNVSKGFCEKGDGGFFITPDGLKKLGHGA